MNTDLVAFVRARLDEHEQIAQAATVAPWTYDERFNRIEASALDDSGLACDINEANGAHIAANDPAHVLTWTFAVRTIINDYMRESWVLGQRHRVEWTEGGQDARVEALRALAAVWRHHPDYRQDWTA